MHLLTVAMKAERLSSYEVTVSMGDVMEIKPLHNFILKFTLYGVRWNLFVVAHDWASAKAAPVEQSDESEYVVIDGERRRVVPCPDGRQGCEVLHTEPITNEEAR